METNITTGAAAVRRLGREDAEVEAALDHRGKCVRFVVADYRK